MPRLRNSEKGSRKAKKRDRSNDNSNDKNSLNSRKRTRNSELGEPTRTPSLPAITTQPIECPSSSGIQSNPRSPSSSQGSSNSDSTTNHIALHRSVNFKKYLRDVKLKSIPGSWQEFDYEKAATESRYNSVANWLRIEKPKLQHLLYNGERTGYYKCVDCAERGCLHIVKACSSTVSKFKIQNVQKHFQSKAHKESHVNSKLVAFSSEWRKAMDIRYLKLMAKHHISGGVFKSDEFSEIIMSWINEVSNKRVDVETIKKEIPDRRTLQRRLDDLSIQVRGNLWLFSQKCSNSCEHCSNIREHCSNIFEKCWNTDKQCSNIREQCSNI